MYPTPNDQIYKLQQELNRIDDNINFKKEVLLRGIGNDQLQSNLRKDIHTLQIESRKLSEKIVKLKLQVESQMFNH
jgi:predicted  nucleic acid-binding Zn-ribbon protein